MDPTRLDYLAAARFSGSDAAGFLQSQLTADIAALAPGDSSFAAYCSPKGQVLALLLVCREGEDFRIAGSAELLPSVLARLRIYVFRSRVEFGPETDIAVVGVQADDPGQAFDPGVGGLRYRFAGPDEPTEAASEIWKWAELERNVAWLDKATSEKFIPQMLGYDRIGALSFSKGCYPGQEIVARARYLGRVKRKPLILTLPEMPDLPAGQKVDLLRRGEWVPAVVIDTAGDGGGGGLVLTVTAEREEALATELRVDDRGYTCATI